MPPNSPLGVAALVPPTPVHSSVVHALVTGSNGFVGRHLDDLLKASGDRSTGTDRTLGGPDLNDLDGLCRVVAAASPDVVIHLAGQADVGSSWDAPLKTFQVNAGGTLNVVLACQAANVKRLVMVSSADVYGSVSPSDLPITEDQPLSPVTPYAASKAAAEMVAIQAGASGMEVIRTRSFNHIGPGQSPQFVASALAQRIACARASGEPTIAIGNLDTVRDMTDVRDVVRAYRLLALHGRPGHAYNVCTGTGRSIREVAETLVELAGGGIDLLEDPSLVREVDTPRLIGSPDKLKEDTGWEPTISFEETLSDILADAIERTT